jgi:hypothetical protein
MSFTLCGIPIAIAIIIIIAIAIATSYTIIRACQSTKQLLVLVGLLWCNDLHTNQLDTSSPQVLDTELVLDILEVVDNGCIGRPDFVLKVLALLYYRLDLGLVVYRY